MKKPETLSPAFLRQATLAALALLLSLCDGAQAQTPGGFEAALLDALRADALVRWGVSSFSVQ